MHVKSPGNSIIRALQLYYRMAPTAFLPELPNTGIALARWRRLQSGLSHIIESPNCAYTLSLILKPMCARSWFGTAPVWSGPIQANTIRLTPPGVRPRWQSDGSFDVLLFIIPSNTVEMIAGQEALELPRLLSKSPVAYMRDDLALQIGSSMLRISDSQQPYMRQVADGLGYALVAHVLNHYLSQTTQETSNLTRFRRVTDYIGDHLTDEIRVRQLARLAGKSESQFAHSFRSATGVTPHRYITSARIEKAQRMLCNSGGAISAIAQDCGFKDASHFSRVFRAATGLRPKDFRRVHGTAS